METCTNAFSTADAILSVQVMMPCGINVMHFIRASPDTSTAFHTYLLMEEQLRLRRDAFRIVAPDTVQWASLEKNRVTHTRAVMNGQPADGCNWNNKTRHVSTPVFGLRNEGILD